MTLRPPKGRPPTWPANITAPQPVLEFYRLLAKLSKTPGAFESCHVYHGAQNQNGTPLLKFNTQVTKLPFVIASYMGLPQAQKRCDTPGCCNPFHYLPSDLGENLLVSGHRPLTEQINTPDPGLPDWIELVEYEMDKRALRAETVTFHQLRAFIDPMDLSDLQIQDALKVIQEK